MFKLYFFLFISLINHTHLFHLSAHFICSVTIGKYIIRTMTPNEKNVLNNFETIFGCFFIDS